MARPACALVPTGRKKHIDNIIQGVNSIPMPAGTKMEEMFGKAACGEVSRSVHCWSFRVWGQQCGRRRADCRADYAPGRPSLSMRLRPNQAERLFRRHHVTPLVISLNGKQQPGQGNQNGNSTHHGEQAAHRRT